MDCLNIAGDGIMGIVEIPKIDIKLPIYHTTREDVLQVAAGHLEGSSLPVGGKEQCAEFIKKSLASMPQERCVNKTIQRTYRREDILDAVFTKSHRDVEY